MELRVSAGREGKVRRRELEAEAASYEAPIGTLWLAFTERGYLAVSLATRAAFRTRLASRGVRIRRELPARELPFGLRDRLDAYFSGEPVDLARADVPIWFAWGTPFQRAVWQAIRCIPYGQTRSYSWLARQVGRPRAARAVGQAVKANPLLLLVPCHRVVRADGSIGGFTPSLEVKLWLLRLEGARLK